MSTGRSFTGLLALLAAITLAPVAMAADQDFNGQWDIQVHAQPAAFAQFTTTAAWWLDISGAGTPQMKIQFVGSPDGSLDDITIAKIQNGVLHFTWKASPRHGHAPGPNEVAEYEAKLFHGVLQGSMTSPATSPATHLTFTGYRSPKIDDHDDGSWVEGKPIRLFDGKSLEGWTGVNSPAMKGWSVTNGLLDCADSSDDLITARKFWNFALHVEYKFPVGKRSNNGIGLRGRYEFQMAADYGEPPSMHGTGALYTRILPRVNAARPGGEWNSLDIRLVGREITAVLNGQTLYKRSVIVGLNGIAIDPFEGRPGPIELQGDETATEFRNLVLVPLTRRSGKQGK